MGEYAFRNYSMACNTDEMDALQTEIGNWLNSLKTVQAIKARFEALKSTAVGKPFVDIAGENIILIHRTRIKRSSSSERLES